MPWGFLGKVNAIFKRLKLIENLISYYKLNRYKNSLSIELNRYKIAFLLN
jgi:hypothetical protein